MNLKQNKTLHYSLAWGRAPGRRGSRTYTPMRASYPGADSLTNFHTCSIRHTRALISLMECLRGGTITGVHKGLGGASSCGRGGGSGPLENS